MSTKKSAEKKQLELNEKTRYRTKCLDWKNLKVGGDISTMATLYGKSNVTISTAVNKGIGSLSVLRKVNQYFKERKTSLTAD